MYVFLQLPASPQENRNVSLTQPLFEANHLQLPSVFTFSHMMQYTPVETILNEKQILPESKIQDVRKVDNTNKKSAKKRKKLTKIESISRRI